MADIQPNGLSFQWVDRFNKYLKMESRDGWSGIVIACYSTNSVYAMGKISICPVY